MTKTTTTARVRQSNLYTIERDGQPVAQAQAISQAEAVRLYVESVQQPTMSARLSTPIEARTLAHLPLLQREPAAVDAKTEDLFGDAPAADHVEDSRAMVEPLAAGGFAPCGRALGDCGNATQTCGRDGCGVELAQIAAGLPAEFVDYIDGQEPAAEQPGEPAELVLLDASAPAVCDPVQIGETSSPSGLPAEFLDYLEGEEVAAAPQGESMPSAPSTAAPTVSPAPAAVELPDADEPTQAERMAGAYAAGVEIARQGHTRWSAEFLDANASALSGLRDAAADEVHAEMLRGFEDGKPIPRKPELKQQAEAATARAGGKIVAKYRHPADGQTWTDRGLKPKWLLAALEAGRTQDEFLIDPA